VGGGPVVAGKWTITSPAIAEVGKLLRKAVDELAAKAGKVVLVIDQLDFLLAAAGGEGGAAGVELREVLLELREVTIILRGVVR
jgi:elongator complex protein 6